MAAEGASTVIADINVEAAEQLASELWAAGQEALAVGVDVSDEAGVASMIAESVTAFGGIDVLVNNAALLAHEHLVRDAAITDLDVDNWDRTMAVNLRGVMLGCKHAIPHMVPRGGGAIINAASIAALTGDALRPAYGASKGAVVAFTRCVATQYGHRGIRANAIAPGLMLTEHALDNIGRDMIEETNTERLIKRPGTPEDFAGLAVFLASDDAAWITGQTYVMDGGLTAHRPAYTLEAYKEWRSSPVSTPTSSS